MEIFKKLKREVLKAIQAIKVGEAGFKVGADGSYFNALDTIPDTFKFMDDAIAASGVNEDGVARLTYGINCESSEYFNGETKQYDLEGPKNLMEPEQMADWYCQQCKEHPLLAYLEDPFQEPQGYQLIQSKLTEQEVGQKVDVVLNTFLEANLDKLKDCTTLIEPEPQPEGEKEEQEKEEEEEAPVEEPPKEEKKEDKKKGGKKGKDAPQAEEEEEEPKEIDPNADKFHPTGVYWTRGKVSCFSELLMAINYAASQPGERGFGIVIDDDFYESMDNFIVDFAFGLGAMYLNVKGINGMQKISKVVRFEEVYHETHPYKAPPPEEAKPKEEGQEE